MTVKYKLWEGRPNATRQRALLDVIHRVFGDASSSSDQKMSRRFTNMPVFSCFCAEDSGRIVGFKAGYALKAGHYYRWLGGVDPEYRRQGIANELMLRQHSWLKEQGYGVVETGAVQDKLAMSGLNLQSGFKVTGRRATPHGVFPSSTRKACDADNRGTAPGRTPGLIGRARSELRPGKPRHAEPLPSTLNHPEPALHSGCGWVSLR